MRLPPDWYRSCQAYRDADHELRDLSEYLELIAELPSFEELDHRRWEEYVSRRRRRAAAEK